MNTLDELFARTLSGSYDDDKPWEAVRELQTIGSREVFERAALWCRSDDALKRARGANVLAQLGSTAEHPTNTYADESFAIVAQLAETEQSDLPLNSAIYALGHIRDLRGMPIIAMHSAHPNADIRHAVAFACGCFGKEKLSVETLLTLIRDDDSDVRDWATFGLGTLSDSDSPEIREAFVGGLSDTDEDVRGEALVGLARRKDLRVLPILISRFKQAEMDDWTVEAASWMLDLPNLAPEWEAREFIAALNERFAKPD